MKKFVIFWIFVLLDVGNTQNKLENYIDWTVLDFNWISNEQKTNYHHNKLYIAQNVIPTDFVVASENKIFVVTVYFEEGVPASLSYLVPKNDSNSNEPKYVLQPYPDWSWHNSTENCKNKINNARAIQIDKCNRLWVLDAMGINETKSCDAQLLAFDLSTNKLVHQIPLSHLNMSKSQLLTNLFAANEDNSCDTQVLITDSGNSGIIRVNILKNKTIDVSEDFYDVFKMDTEKIAIKKKNITINIPIGIIGIDMPTLNKKTKNNYLYIRSLSSKSFYLCNYPNSESFTKLRCEKYENIFKHIGSAVVSSLSGILFFNSIEDSTIGCWDIESSITTANFNKTVVADDNLGLVAALKIVNINQIDYLYTLNIHLDVIPDRVNHRIMRAPIKNFESTCKSQK